MEASLKQRRISVHQRDGQNDGGSNRGRWNYAAGDKLASADRGLFSEHVHIASTCPRNSLRLACGTHDRAQSWHGPLGGQASHLARGMTGNSL